MQGERGNDHSGFPLLCALFFTARKTNAVIYSSGTHTKKMVLVQEEALLNTL